MQKELNRCHRVYAEHDRQLAHLLCRALRCIHDRQNFKLRMFCNYHPDDFLSSASSREMKRQKEYPLNFVKWTLFR
jgi:hypothetical protein